MLLDASRNPYRRVTIAELITTAGLVGREPAVIGVASQVANGAAGVHASASSPAGHGSSVGFSSLLRTVLAKPANPAAISRVSIDAGDPGGAQAATPRTEGPNSNAPIAQKTADTKLVQDNPAGAAALSQSAIPSTPNEPLMQTKASAQASSRRTEAVSSKEKTDDQPLTPADDTVGSSGPPLEPSGAQAEQANAASMQTTEQGPGSQRDEQAAVLTGAAKPTGSVVGTATDPTSATASQATAPEPDLSASAPPSQAVPNTSKFGPGQVATGSVTPFQSGPAYLVPAVPARTVSVTPEPAGGPRSEPPQANPPVLASTTATNPDQTQSDAAQPSPKQAQFEAAEADAAVPTSAEFTRATDVEFASPDTKPAASSTAPEHGHTASAQADLVAPALVDAPAAATPTAAAMPPAAAAPRHGSITDQVTPSLTSALRSQGDGSIVSVSLTPGHLGTVSITVTRNEDGSAAIQLGAEHLSTLELLHKDQAELTRALDQAGFAESGHSLSFAWNGAEANASGAGPQDWSGHRGQPSPQKPGDDPQPAEDTPGSQLDDGRVNVTA